MGVVLASPKPVSKSPAIAVRSGFHPMFSIALALKIKIVLYETVFEAVFGNKMSPCVKYVM